MRSDFTFFVGYGIIFLSTQQEAKMLRSEIKTVGGVPRLYIDGRAETAIAYTTYFEERSAYRVLQRRKSTIGSG